MKMLGRWITTVVVILGIGVCGIASATNGYMTHGTGTKNKGMAGAGIALPDDAISTVHNPAVAVLVGNKMEIGAALFNPNRSYRTSPSQCQGHYPCFTVGPNDISSSNNWFVLPHFARSWQKGEDNAFAVAFYGRGGMNTTWKGGTASFDPDGPGPGGPITLPGSFGAGQAGVDLSLAFLDLTFARKLNDRVSLGISGIIGMQVFEVTGATSFAGFTETFARSGGMTFPDSLSNNGHDFPYGAGLRIGLHSALTDTLNFGISYQTKVYMTEFDDYSDLFANQGDFDIPADFKAGLTFQPRENLAISLDVEHIWYSDVDSVGNSGMNVFQCPPFGNSFSHCLGGNDGAGFGWDDMTVYKIGAQWGSGSDWTWRAGYSYGSQPIPNTEMTFNIFAPGVMEDHLTFGATKKLSGGNELNFSLMYAPKVSLKGPNNFDPTQTVEFEMDQFEFEFSYGWKF
jgi:long-chain fatty acid transport protein